MELCGYEKRLHGVTKSSRGFISVYTSPEPNMAGGSYWAPTDNLQTERSYFLPIVARGWLMVAMETILGQIIRHSARSLSSPGKVIMANLWTVIIRG